MRSHTRQGEEKAAKFSNKGVTFFRRVVIEKRGGKGGRVFSNLLGIFPTKR